MASMAAVAAAATGALLLVAAFGKLVDHDPWRQLVSAIGGDGNRGRLLRVSVPAVEGLVAVAVLCRPRAGLVVTAALFVAFALGVERLRPRMEGAACGCFGPLAGGSIGRALSVENLVLAAVALAAAPFAPVVGPPPATTLVGGAAAASAFLLFVRGERRHLQRAVRPGSRIRLAGVPARGPRIIVLLSPRCPSCEHLAPRLRELAAALPVPVSVAIRPGDGQRDVAAAVGDLYEPGLWERFARRRHVAGTPFGVAVDPDGRVHAAGYIDAERLSRMAQALVELTDVTPRHTRAAALRRAILASGSVLWLGNAAAAAGGRRARAAQSSWTFDYDPRNEIVGSCERFRGAVGRGVYTAAGDRIPDGVGYTWAEGFETGPKCSPPAPKDRLPITAAVDRKRVTRTWRGHCPCPTKKPYTDESRCKAECTSTLQCFGQQCVTDSEEYCVEVSYSLRASHAPKITITALQWRPPPASSPRCKVYAQSFNRFIRHHEEQHARDVLDVLSDWEQKNTRRSMKRCGPTEHDAMSAVLAAIESETDSAYADLMQGSCARARSYHGRSEGQYRPPNCEMCK